MDQSKYTDGMRALASLTVANLSNGYNYTSQGGSIDEAAEHVIFYDDDMQHVGSDTRSKEVTGSLTCTYEDSSYTLLTDDHRFRIGQVLLYRGAYYTVTGYTGNEALRTTLTAQLTVTQLVCPVLTNMLSDTAQAITDTHSAAAGAYTFAPTVANTRAGSTITYELEEAVAGVAINSSTGVVTIATPSVGTYEVTVICVDTPASGVDIRKGYAQLTVTVSA